MPLVFTLTFARTFRSIAILALRTGEEVFWVVVVVVVRFFMCVCVCAFVALSFFPSPCVFCSIECNFFFLLLHLSTCEFYHHVTSLVPNT